MLQNPIKGHFTISHLCAIHRYLFGDVYFFAGHIRTESIAKGQTRFESPQSIKPKLKILFDDLQKETCLQNAGDDFIKRLACYFAELNYIHPFREGNGRATREFVRLLLLHNGFTVDWSAAGVEVLLDAMEMLVYNISVLIEVLKKCVSVRVV